MNVFQNIIPYIKRTEDPVLWVHKDIEKPYKVKKVAKKVNAELATEPEDEFNILVWDASSMSGEFAELYDKLAKGGIVFLTGGTFQRIDVWRRANKQSSLVHTLPDDIYFWFKPRDDVRTQDRIPNPKDYESHVTQEILEKYAIGDTFVETGTYFGHTIGVALESEMFNYIASIELDEDLAKRAKKMYEDLDNVEVLCGDSPMELAGFLDRTEIKPMTFWLDAHASGPLPGGMDGGTPVLEELKAIKDFADPLSTIMIDDCRLFGTNEWSYVQKEDAITLIKEINPDYTIVYEDGEIEDDVLIAYMKR